MSDATKKTVRSILHRLDRDRGDNIPSYLKGLQLVANGDVEGDLTLDLNIRIDWVW